MISMLLLLNIIVNPSACEGPVTASLARAPRVPDGRHRLTDLDRGYIYIYIDR